MAAMQQVLFFGNSLGSTDPYWANVIFLGRSSDSSFIDVTGRHSPTANGVADIGTGAEPTLFGDYMPSVVGGTGYYSLDSSDPNGQDFNFSVNPFTVEGWVFTVSSSGGPPLFAGALATDWNMPLYTDSTTSGRFYYNASSFFNPTTLPSNTLFHYALCRNGTSLKVFINGSEVGSATVLVTDSFGTITPQPNYFLGNTVHTGWRGYASEIRITKGVARYSGNFSVPTAKFPSS